MSFLFTFKGTHVTKSVTPGALVYFTCYDLLALGALFFSGIHLG